MARPKKEIQEGTQVAPNLNSIVSSLIKKKYGDGLLISAMDIIDNPPEIISVSPRIDSLLNGGITSSSWINVVGPPKFGKTTLILRMAKASQEKGYNVLYANIEHRLKRMNLEGCKGLDYRDPEKFMILQSSSEKILNGEEYLNIIEDYLKTKDKVFCILDSLSSLAHPKQIEEGVGTATRGGMGVLTAQFVNNIAPVVSQKGHIIVCVQQFYSNTSGYGKTKLAGGGTKIVYQGDCILETRQKTEIKSGDKIIGQSVTWECECSSLGSIPGTKTDSVIKYGIGIYPEMELVEMAKEVGVIDSTDKGSWLTYNEQKVQGVAKFAEMLENNPELYAEIEQKVKNMYAEMRSE
jgi:RecA/RadA recombinase